MSEKNIITTLIEQHHGLKKDLELVAKVIGEDTGASDKVVTLLGQFEKDLVDHLELENNQFYPELLSAMKTKGQDPSKTEQFIDEMKNIEKTVVSFLNKYRDAAGLDKNINDFKKEFPDITTTLSLRIESEEAGVYAYWGLF
jgi:hemerythrin-like domain-containing protein